MTIISLDDLLDFGETHARDTLLIRREEMLTSFYHLVGEPGGERQNAIIPCQWRNDIQKQIMVLAVKKIAREMHAIAALLLAESWMVKIAETDPKRLQERYDNLGPPSQSPNRIEVVTIAATDGRVIRQRILQIIRSKPGGKIISLVRDGLGSDGAIQSRLLEGIISPPSVH